jgi:UPF0716 protein FxsA
VFGKLLILMIVVPLVDLLVLLKVATIIEFIPTVVMVIVTGLVGHTLFKKQGMQILRSIQAELSQGRMPGDKIVSGVIVLVGGVLLMTPGFLTDIVGLLFLIPGFRRIMKSYLNKKFSEAIQRGTFTVHNVHKDDYIDG